MNKKISTLLAGAALLSVVSVNAQEPSTPTVVPSAVESSIPVLAPMGSVAKLKEGVNTELYQLKVTIGGTERVLSMDSDGELSFVDASGLDASSMANSLWCVTVSTQAEGQAPKYDFENRATGMLLDIAAGDVKNEGEKYEPQVGGNVSGWAFSRSYKTLEGDKALFSYIDAENILGFTEENGDVKVAKVKATDYNRDNNSYKGTAKFFIEFTLMSPAEIFLNAQQLNTIFGTYDKADHGLKLSFNKDVAGTDIANPFNAQSFYTESAETVTSSDGVRAPYLYVRQKDKESYLRVDTAYTNEKGVPFLAYKWVSDWYDWNNAENEKGTDYGTASAYLANSELKDQYKFLFKYTPKNDNLEIYIHTVTYKDINDESEDNYWYNTTDKGYNNHVSLQDLIKNEIRILTVDKDNQNTTITLGYKSCGAVTPTRTSLADNVYFIRNAEGQYLASPIHKNGTIEWVTVNEKQDVNHMPAFQWIALKNNTADKNNVSAVTFTNREYPVHQYSAVQLNKKADKDYYYVSKTSATTQNGDVAIYSDDQLTIDPVDAVYQSDKYLGYKKISKDDLLVNKFRFNYYHPYSSKMFIAQSDKDSTLSVLENVDAFSLDTVKFDNKSADEAYGYKYADLSKDAKKRLPNLVQLYRTVYKVTKGDKKWAINKEDKFNVSSYWKDDNNRPVDNNGNEQATAFFFKENNCIDGTHYYAILSTSHNIDGTHTILSYDKAGVSDYDPNATLKSQVLTETRTSAFAITPDNSPLYRRFHNVALGESETDAADSLIFVEKYRKEYLMDEANPSFLNNNVDYVGIWSKDKAKGKLAFNVDTAWLHRGSGEVKPQYLISVAREDQAAIETIPCNDEKGQHFYTDANGKVHPTDDASLCDHAQKGRAGFAYGKYLVNFSDSVKAHKYKTPYMDVDGGYTRVGFVKAIHAGDSLFILAQGFENVKPENLDTAEIIKKYKALKVNEKFIVNLQGDRHKNVTWSFRYVNPDKAGSVDEEGVANEFLFESNIYNKDGANTSVKEDGTGKTTPSYGEIGKGTIAPEYAAWLKMQNGCLVLTRGDSKFDKMSTGSDGALIFNAYQKEDADDMVTNNETINTVDGVSVVANDGTVTIQGAAGKSVVISNILGKVVAETVLSSDNATISVPAGIVAVAVEGEAAVKVVVK